MKIVHVFSAWLIIAGFSFNADGASHGGAVHVSGHTTKSGTYVAPHYRSAPDGNFSNNWSTKGNVNPYTGKAGTRTTPSSGSSVSGISNSQVEVVPRVSSPMSQSIAGAQKEAAFDQPIRREPAASIQGDTEKVTINRDLSKVTVQDDNPILDYQKRDAAKGFPEAQYALGMRYLTGNGVPKDEVKGKALVNRAYENGSLRARDKIWQMRRTTAK